MTRSVIVALVLGFVGGGGDDDDGGGTSGAGGSGGNAGAGNAAGSSGGSAGSASGGSAGTASGGAGGTGGGSGGSGGGPVCSWFSNFKGVPWTDNGKWTDAGGTNHDSYLQVFDTSLDPSVPGGRGVRAIGNHGDEFWNVMQVVAPPPAPSVGQSITWRWYYKLEPARCWSTKPRCTRASDRRRKTRWPASRSPTHSRAAHRCSKSAAPV